MKCVHGIQSLSHFWGGLNVGACAQWLWTQDSNDRAAAMEQYFVRDIPDSFFRTCFSLVCV